MQSKYLPQTLSKAHTQPLGEDPGLAASMLLVCNQWSTLTLLLFLSDLNLAKTSPAFQ